MSAAIIRTEDVSKVYRLGTVELHALRSVSLAIESGEMLAIMGPSGSGKSTLLNLIGTLDRPSSGRYFLEGEAVEELGEDELALLRSRKIGFVFQQFNLLPRESALANVELPMLYAGVRPSLRRRRALEVLARVGLADRAHHLPSQLSGGQQQRVSLARALVNQPVLLLADEPTGALDSAMSRQVMELFSELHRENMTIVIVTHDAAVAAYASRVVTFNDGSVLSDVRSPSASSPSASSVAASREASRVSRRRRSLRAWWWLVAAAAVAVGGALWARSRAGSETIDAALVVSTRRGALPIEIQESGRVAPRERVELKSKVAGQVSEVHVEEGDQVHRSQLLMVLDPTDYQREVARAEAEIAQAQAAIDFARQTLERTKRGVAENVLPRAEQDGAEHQLRSGLAALQSARVNLGAAQDRVRYTRILSPIDGIVIQRAIEIGEVVTPGVQATFEGKPLLTIADLSTLLVKVDLNQIDVAKVQLGTLASVSLDALPGKTFAAKVTRIAAASVKPAGKEVELFPVEVELEQAHSAIKPGMSADVTIHLEGKVGVLALPIEAVVRESGHSTVTRVIKLENGQQRTEKVEVSVGARNDRELEVVSGLSEGDRVLIKPGSAAANETQL